MTSKIIEFTVFLTKILVLENTTALCCHFYGAVPETLVSVENRNIHTNNNLTKY